MLVGGRGTVISENIVFGHLLCCSCVGSTRVGHFCLKLHTVKCLLGFSSLQMVVTSPITLPPACWNSWFFSQYIANKLVWEYTAITKYTGTYFLQWCFKKPKEMVAFDKGEEMSLSYFRVNIRNITSEIGMYKVAFLSF